MKRKTITIYDVAEQAGVSVSTVSRVLNKKGDVAEKTIEHVTDVIDRLGFTSSLAARGLRSQDTNVLGVIMPDVESLYSFAVLQGVNKAVAKHGYDLIIYTGGTGLHITPAEKETRFVSLLNGSIVDGVIIVTPTASDFPTPSPVVAIDPHTASPAFPSILSTNHAGALEATRYLIDLGHERIGFITGRLDLVSANHRLHGYLDGLKAAGIPVDPELIQEGDYITETAVALTKKLLTLDDPPTAIFASNDMSAMGVYQAVAELGLRIPDDLSVVGFDNLHDAVYLNPPLTTVDQFISEMGRIAVDMLVQQLNGESLENPIHTIPTKLIIRESCRHRDR